MIKNRKEKELPQLMADLASLLLYSIDADSTTVAPEDIYHLASLLLLSAGIKRVEFDRSEFNQTLGWCSSADHFEDHQYQLEQRIVDGLTRFQFTWLSVESAIDILVPKKISGAPAGKINKLCSFLKTEFEPRTVSKEYKDRLHYLNKLTAEDSHYAKSLRRRSPKAHIGISGYGIDSVYSIRNSLAHGSLGVPTSEQEEERFEDVRLIDCCSVIVGHTLQMLVTAFFANHLDTVNWKHEEVEFETLMSVFHLDVSFDKTVSIEDDLFSGLQ